MANILTPAQRGLVIESLNQDRSCNYSRLEYYLKQIISGRDVTFETRSDQPFVVSSQEAWGIILPWAQGEGNLPVGDRKDLFNVGSRATKLLDYLETNISGKAAETAASYHLILDQAENEVTPSFPSQNPQDYGYQKIYDLRKLQVQILQAGIIGKIYTNLEKSDILAGVPASSRNHVLRMFAAAHQNFRYNPSNALENFTPEKIHQLLLHTPGVKDINSVIRLFYSDGSQKDIKTIVETIESSISEQYPGKEAEYLADMAAMRKITSLSPSMGSVSYLVNNINIHATPAEKIKLIRSIKSQIVGGALGSHASGDALLKAALKSAGFPVPSDLNASVYKSLLPYLEELEVRERHILLGSDLLERDSRILSTAKLAKEIGVDLKTPWLSKRELDRITASLAGNLSLEEAFSLEYSKGSAADIRKLAQFTDLMDKHADYKIYNDSVNGSLWYSFRNIRDKARGRYLSVKLPIDRFTGKLWAGYNDVTDYIFSPIDKLGQWWEKQQELRPWLDPLKLISKRASLYQTNVAINLHAWAIGVSASSWFSTSGFAGHFADFTEGFIKHKGDWDSATSFFLNRKWGNVLDWSTKTITAGKHQTVKSLKISIANTIWSGFSKMAPELSAKLLAGALGNTLKTFLLGELTLGASIAIQVGWEAIKGGFSSIIKFARDVLGGNSANLFGTIPLLLGSLFVAVNVVLGGIPVAIIISFKLLKIALKMMWDFFVALLALSALVTISLIAFFTFMWFSILSPTFHLDSGAAQIITSILCDDDQVDVGVKTEVKSNKSSVASCADCLVKYLTACYGGGKLTGSLVTSKFGCLLASKLVPGAAEAIKASAVGYNWLQCVGFAKAAAICGGGDLPGQAVASGYIRNQTPGYKFVQGAEWCVPGDFGIIDGPIGHIFVVSSNNSKSNASGMLTGIDANFVGDGVVSNNTPFPASMVAGCLKKI